MADDKKAEVKQGAITEQDLKKEKRLKAPGMRGSYKGVVFDDDGLSSGPVSKEVREALTAQFPGLKVEEVEIEVKG